MKLKTDEIHCPLCRGGNIKFFHEDKQRAYVQCSHCRLVFVPRHYWLNAAEEKATYDLHRNHPGDPGYRKFLSRLSEPLLEKLGAEQHGLDFGCGPGPTLSSLLETHGHRVDLYDPFYFNDPSIFRKKYDFICASEVVEHLHAPDREFSALFEMLKPGGWLALMTKLVIDRQAFARWHYIRDLTHICFYCRDTFEYLAGRYCTTLEYPAKDVILLNRK